MSGKSASILVKILGDEAGFKKSLGEAGTGVDSFAKKMDAHGQRMQNVGAKMTAGVTLPIVALGALSVKNFMEAERSQAQLEASLKSTGATAWTSASKIDALAGSMQKKYAVDGDLVKSGASLLLTFTSVKNAAGAGNDIFDRTTKTALDMSRKLGIDLPAANMLLGKSLNDPVRGMGALRKAGVQLTEQQQEQVKAFVASGDVMSAQKVILGELEHQFAGSAEAYAKTTEGKLEAAKLALEDVTEEIGAKIVPVLTSMGDGLVTALDKWDGLSDGTQNFILVTAGVAAAIGPVTTIVGTLMRAGTVLGDMRGKLTQVTESADGSTTSLTRTGKAAVALGAVGAALAVYQMGKALNDATKDAVGLETAVNRLKVADGPKDVASALRDASTASEGFLDKLSNIGNNLGGGMWDTGSVEVQGYSIELDKVDEVLKSVKDTGDADLLGKTIAAFRSADTSAITGLGSVSAFNDTLDSYAEYLDSSAAAATDAAKADGTYQTATEEAATETADLSAEVKTLTDRLHEMQGGARDVDEAQRSLLDANTSLVASFAENGKTLDVTTDAGRRNTDALVAQIDASFALAGKQAALDTTGRTATATLVAQAGSLKDLRAKGIIPTDAEYNRLLLTYGLTPDQITTRIQANTTDAKSKSAELTATLLSMPGVPAPVVSRIQGLINRGSLWEAEQAINEAARSRTATIDVVLRGINNVFTAFGMLPKRAQGGPVRAGKPYLVGEEGPEVVIPDGSGTVLTAAETSALSTAGRPGLAASSSSSVVVEVHFHGPVANDSIRWVTDALETAVAKGMQMPRLRRSLSR